MPSMRWAATKEGPVAGAFNTGLNAPLGAEDEQAYGETTVFMIR